MAEDESWKRYLTPEAARRSTYEDLAAEREHELDVEVRRMRIIRRISELSAQIATAEERQDYVDVARLLELRNAADDEFDHLDEET
ncbi:MAG: hypothetical protein IPN92_08895 [Chromatiaceae bacterium]|nr:hypothetical protein [Chromatiaceae bacterium]